MPRTNEIQQVNVVEVVRHGEQIVIPESLDYDQAIQAIYARMQQDNETVAIHIRFDGAFVLDGALALQKALAEKFGWTNLRPTPGFFGPEPPQMIGVAIGPGDTVQVPWGRMSVPGITGWLGTGHEMTRDGRMVFVLTGQVLRKFQKQVDELVALIKLHLLKGSIYKGKAIRLRFHDADGERLPMPEPQFMDLSQVKPDELIFSASVDAAIDANLFTPIEKAQQCRDLAIPLKRGVLLAGPYGVGKTLAAYVAASKAQENHWTFVYCETSPELADVVRFAQQYTPAVVFCEDIDRVASGERDVDMDDMLAIVDGIGSKDTELIIVLTTNAPEDINQAMLRPGRLDAIVNVSAPDAEAASRLIQLYARGRLAEGIDLTEVGERLANQIPAVIRECVERSKLHALSLADAQDSQVVITAQALLDAAEEMQFALKLLQPKEYDGRSKREKAASILADAIATNSSNGSRTGEAVAG